MSKDVMWTSCGQNRYKSWSPSRFFKLQTSMGINQVPRSYTVWESTRVLKWTKLLRKYTFNSSTSMSLILFKFFSLNEIFLCTQGAVFGDNNSVIRYYLVSREVIKLLLVWIMLAGWWCYSYARRLLTKCFIAIAISSSLAQASEIKHCRFSEPVPCPSLFWLQRVCLHCHLVTTISMLNVVTQRFLPFFNTWTPQSTVRTNFNLLLKLNFNLL